MVPILSIIIPCYKSSRTVEETLQSVLDQEFTHWEAIIINDGSPDNLEEIVLPWTKMDNRFIYFKKENGGLGSARNFGIQKARGQYILPLDSDNKVRPQFATNAINVFSKEPTVGIVHGNAHYFGSKKGIWKVAPFDAFKMLTDNYIDACAMIKREVFTAVGLYDQAMPYQGHEDWEFWIRTIDSDFTFYYLDETCFDYRVTNDSMIRTFNDKMTQKNIEYIVHKHWKLYYTHFRDLQGNYASLKKAMSQSKLLKLSKFTKLFRFK
jgi:glycosyltransferase involved in cell wall biosynthesis